MHLALLALVAACATPASEAPLPAPESPEAHTAALVLPTPASARELGLHLSLGRRERSRDSHGTTATVLLADHALAVRYAATGRAKGHERPPADTTLTDAQLAEVRVWIEEAGLLEPRTVAGHTGSDTTSVSASASVWFAGAEPVLTAVTGERGGLEGGDVRDDTAYRAIGGLVRRLEALAR
ncbi:MAG: hypothetical protein EP330_14440 [Deltaproteobacteria bacterium]|nr:MAG: hypothetical protein EP330_14440 [Deltaproteobacteria bacterium]